MSKSCAFMPNILLKSQHRYNQWQCSYKSPLPLRSSTDQCHTNCSTYICIEKWHKQSYCNHILQAVKGAFRGLPSVCVFGCFPFGFGVGMWDLIVSVPDHCLSFYFSGAGGNHNGNIYITFPTPTMVYQALVGWD